VFLKRSSASKDKKFCSNACVVARMKELARLWREEISKECQICKKVFHPRPDESKPGFEKRKTCSSICASYLPSRHPHKVLSDTKVCVGCGEGFTRKRLGKNQIAQSPDKFATQKFCSRKCYLDSKQKDAKLTATIDKVRPEKIVPTKTCVVCNKTFELRRGETKRQFEERKACSHSCARALYPQRKTLELTKSCPSCSKEMTRRSDEKSSNWKKRKFCSGECANKKKTGRPPGERAYVDRPKKPRNISAPQREVRNIAKPEITVAEALAKIVREKEDLTVQDGGELCACGNHGKNPFTGMCSTCWVKKNWQQGSQENKVKPRMEHRAGS
jgi:hypothetical protein